MELSAQGVLEQILQFQPEIQTAIAQRVRAAQLEAEAGILKENADRVLYAAMESNGINKILHDYGEFQRITPGVSTTLDKNKLRELLVDAGIDTKVMNSCFVAATKAGERKGYVKFVIKRLPDKLLSEMEV